MQVHTAAEATILRTAESLTHRTKIQLVSRSNLNDVRLEIDTGAADYDPERCGIEDGSVTVNTQSGPLRSLSLSLVDWTGDWFPGYNRSVWLDAMVRVWRGYTTTQLWPQGLFEIADPELPGNRRVRLAGADKSIRAGGQEQGGFINPIEISKDTNLKTALEALVSHDTWNETLLNLAATDKTMPYTLKCELSDSPWEIAQRIGGIPGNRRPLYYDEAGYLTWMEDPDPNNLNPVWQVWEGGSRPGTALAGEFSSLISAAKQIDTREFKNWVGVIGASALSVPVRAVALDDSTASATSVSRVGYRMHWYNGGRPDSLITTVEEAQARADYELRRLLQWQERVPLTLTELPILQPWDVLRVTVPDSGLADTYQVVSYTLPLGARVEMPVQAWRVRRAVA